MAAAGAGTTALAADEQTGGKGRAGRKFCSPSGSGLYLSVLLRSLPFGDVQSVTPRAAVAACRAIHKVFAIRPGIKWVNDVVTQSGKVAGILTEAGFKANGSLDWVVMGIGINICEPEDGFPEEIRDVAGAILPDRLPKEEFEKTKQELSRVFLEEFFKILNIYDLDQQTKSKENGVCARNGRDSWIDEYRKFSIMTDKRVKVYSIAKEKEQGRDATVLGIGDDCSLRVRYDNGKGESLRTGEVSISLS